MVQVGDCFYYKSHDTIYLIEKAVSEDLARAIVIYRYYQNDVRSNYAVFEHLYPWKVFNALIRRVPVDPQIVRKIKKLIALNGVACRNILKRAPILKSGYVHLYNYGDCCLSYKDKHLDVGETLIGINTNKVSIGSKYTSIDIFKDIELKINNTLNLIDDLWNTFSESKVNG